MYIGQLSSAKAAQEGLQTAIVCVDYLEAQVSKENFVNIQQAIGWLVDELCKEGFTSRLTDTYWQKELPLWYATMRRPGTVWVVRYQLLRPGRTLKLKMVGLEALPTYEVWQKSNATGNAVHEPTKLLPPPSCGS
jgi:hypothetical protein